MTAILIIWAILGPSIGLVAGCLLNAGTSHDRRLQSTGPWADPRGHHRHS